MSNLFVTKWCVMDNDIQSTVRGWEYLMIYRENIFFLLRSSYWIRSDVNRKNMQKKKYQIRYLEKKYKYIFVNEHRKWSDTYFHEVRIILNQRGVEYLRIVHMIMLSFSVSNKEVDNILTHILYRKIHNINKWISLGSENQILSHGYRYQNISKIDSNSNPISIWYTWRWLWWSSDYHFLTIWALTFYV